jgi:alpha-L-fucosidase
MTAHAARLQRFTDARFGIFIHWGLKSGTGGQPAAFVREPEAKRRAARFHEEAQAFDPAAWAETFRAAGAGYVVFTPRHCASRYHCLYPSALTELDSPRDFVTELGAACREAGLQYLLYVALEDAQWRRDYLERLPAELEACLAGWYDRQGAHMRELVERCAPDGVWLDGWPYHVTCYEAAGLDARAAVDFARLTAPARAADPELLVGNKEVRDGAVDFLASEFMFQDHFGRPLASDRPIEVCDYLPGSSWFARHGEETEFLSAAELAEQSRLYTQRLVSCLGRGVNYLLNLGPLPDGALQGQEAAILRAMGEWLMPRAKTLRGEGLVPAGEGPWGYAVRRGERAYLHVLDSRGIEAARGRRLRPAERESLKRGVPADGRVELPSELGTARRAELYDSGAALPLADGGRAVDLTGTDDDPVDLIVALELAGG